MNKIYLNGQIAYREDILSNWEAKNPVLERGEPAIIRDGINGRWLKIGDGVTAFNDLPYKLGPKGDKGDQGEQGVSVTGAEINSNGELVLIFSNNQRTNVGKVIGAKGDKGDKGDAYILTEADKTEIAEEVKSMFVDVSEVGQ